jgi:hypothetical protein
MFTDSDWDNSAPAPLESASRLRRAAILAMAMGAGLLLGFVLAGWWWAPRHGVAGSTPTAPAAAALAASAAALIASAPPSRGPTAPSAAVEPRAALPPPALASAPAPRSDPAAAARRKELAWSQWYEKPRECIEDRRGERLVECANHYIRARREFEATYGAR